MLKLNTCNHAVLRATDTHTHESYRLRTPRHCAPVERDKLAPKPHAKTPKSQTFKNKNKTARENNMLTPLLTLGACSDASLQTRWHDVYLDHFDLSANSTFPLRFLVDESCTSRSAREVPQRIVMYVGNEGSIEDFAANSGFLWTLAKRWRAVVVLVEERYFGASVPAQPVTRYLSSAQVLGDNVQVITEALRPRYGAGTQIVAVGGSYGGMLAAWLRRQHPSLVAAAYASSAPVLGFAAAAGREGGADPAGFWRVVERAFAAVQPAGDACVGRVRAGLDSLVDARANGTALAQISRIFGLCAPLAPADAAREEVASDAFYSARGDAARTADDLLGFLQHWLQA